MFSFIKMSDNDEVTTKLVNHGYSTDDSEMLCVRSVSNSAGVDMVMISAGSNIHIYRIESSEFLYQGTTTNILGKGNKTIVSFAFYDDGNKILIATNEKTIHIFSLTVKYDLNNYRYIGKARFPYEGPIRDIYVSKNEKLVILTPLMIYIFPISYDTVTYQSLPATTLICDYHKTKSTHFTAFSFSSDESIMSMVQDGSKDITKFNI